MPSYDGFASFLITINCSIANSTCIIETFFKNKSNRYLTFGACKSQTSIPLAGWQNIENVSNM